MAKKAKAKDRLRRQQQSRLTEQRRLSELANQKTALKACWERLGIRA